MFGVSRKCSVLYECGFLIFRLFLSCRHLWFLDFDNNREEARRQLELEFVLSTWWDEKICLQSVWFEYYLLHFLPSKIFIFSTSNSFTALFLKIIEYKYSQMYFCLIHLLCTGVGDLKKWVKPVFCFPLPPVLYDYTSPS